MASFRRGIALALVIVAAVVVLWRARAPQAQGSTPRLFVLMVVDQMRFDYLERYRDRFTDGFKRLWDNGAVFTEAHYPYASTKTAEAHALMLTGWSPSGTGIIGDKWYDKRIGGFVTAGASANHKLVDTGAEGGSPEQLLVHTLGDALKEQRPRSMVLTASWKRYTGILNGGHHADAAYWMDDATGHMVTSDYYLHAYPEWVSRFNATDLTAPLFGKTWMNHRFGTGEAPDEQFRIRTHYSNLPNPVLLEFGKALLENTGVGTDADPDIVALSFSGLDFIGHEYGPESPEFDDVIVQQDRLIGDLLRTLDARIGQGNYTVALTADHGAALVPEKQKARGIDAGRLNMQAFRVTLEKTVTEKLHISSPIVAAWDAPELWLDYVHAAEQGVSRSALDRAVVAAIEAQPGIAHAYTVDDIAGAGASHDPLLRAVAEGYYPDRSGDIHVLVKPNYIFWGAAGTTHGTPYEYDNHVPLMLMGARVKPGKYADPVRVNDLAPTVGQILGVPFKGDPNGRPLSIALQ